MILRERLTMERFTMEHRVLKRMIAGENERKAMVTWKWNGFLGDCLRQIGRVHLEHVGSELELRHVFNVRGVLITVDLNISKLQYTGDDRKDFLHLHWKI